MSTTTTYKPADWIPPLPSPGVLRQQYAIRGDVREQLERALRTVAELDVSRDSLYVALTAVEQERDALAARVDALERELAGYQAAHDERTA